MNLSDWDCTLEPTDGPRRALRLGLRLIKGLRREEAEKLVALRGGGYRSPLDLWQRAVGFNRRHRAWIDAKLREQVDRDAARLIVAGPTAVLCAEVPVLPNAPKRYVHTQAPRLETADALATSVLSVALLQFTLDTQHCRQRSH